MRSSPHVRLREASKRLRQGVALDACLGRRSSASICSALTLAFARAKQEFQHLQPGRSESDPSKADAATCVAVPR